jgi:RND family efflux transporter MFP subunit
MQSLLAGDVGRMHRDAPRVCNLSAWHKVRNEKVTLARPHPGTACRHHSFAGAFIYVGLRSGPLAPVAVTVASVESRAITPALFGIGTVEARYTYKIGPTFAGRVKRLEVHVGDQVKAGQVLGEMEPVDLDDRVRSQESVFKRAEAALREAEARQAYAQTQARRYEQLFAVRSTSEEIVTTKRQELQIADAALSAARKILPGHAPTAKHSSRSGNLRLIAPVDGVVAVRDADPGTTIVAGQAVVEVIDPKSLWINVRFDQISASGLAGGCRLISSCVRVVARP